MHAFLPGYGASLFSNEVNLKLWKINKYIFLTKNQYHFKICFKAPFVQQVNITTYHCQTNCIYKAETSINVIPIMLQQPERNVLTHFSSSLWFAEVLLELQTLFVCTDPVLSEESVSHLLWEKTSSQLNK